MKKFQKTITVYDLGEGFFVEVSRQGAMSEFYMYNDGYAVKHLIFGFENLSEADEEELIAKNADFYIADYKRMYMED